MRRAPWRGIALACGVIGFGLAAGWPDGLPVPGVGRVIESRLLLWGGMLCLVLAVWGRGG